MRRLCATGALLAGICRLLFAQGSAPGEVLIRFKAETPLYRAAAALGSGATVLQSMPEIGVHRIRLAPKSKIGPALAYFRSLPYVDFVEPNFKVRAYEVPNDPQFSQQWYLARISCPEAWDFTHGTSEVVIGIVDTGVDLLHPDLSSKLVPGTDIANGDSIPQDDNGHGTHVCGIAAAATNNGIGVAGVGYATRIMPIKALDQNGDGFVSDVAIGINYAVSHGAKVVSLSLGTTSTSSTLTAAVDNAWQSGVVVVAAAGNDGNNSPHYPAAIPNAIAVGATDENDIRAGFSNYGSWVDVAAPGVEIRSTYPTSSYRFLSGTSMAAPQVAGQAALLWEVLGTSSSPTSIRQRIESSCVPVGSWLANGRIDVERSLPGFEGAEFREAPVQAISVNFGQVLLGNLASLISSDNDRLSILAARVASNRRIEFVCSATPEWAGSRLGIQVTLEASAQPRVSPTVSLWNWSLARWDVLGTARLGSADHRFTFQTPNPDAYCAQNGEVQVKISRNDVRNRLFWIYADKVEVMSISSE